MTRALTITSEQSASTHSFLIVAPSATPLQGWGRAPAHKSMGNRPYTKQVCVLLNSVTAGPGAPTATEVGRGKLASTGRAFVKNQTPINRENFTLGWQRRTGQQGRAGQTSLARARTHTHTHTHTHTGSSKTQASSGPTKVSVKPLSPSRRAVDGAWRRMT